jgi:hypothetical protein
MIESARAQLIDFGTGERLVPQGVLTFTVFVPVLRRFGAYLAK